MKLITTFSAIGLAIALSATNLSSENEMQQRINDVIADHPGGQQTAWNEVTWDGGAIVLTLSPRDESPRHERAVGGCPAGSFCAFAGSNYSSSRLTFSTCTSSHSVAPLGASVRSIANSRTSGQVQALNGSTVVLTVPANSGQNTAPTITSLSCS